MLLCCPHRNSSSTQNITAQRKWNEKPHLDQCCLCYYMCGNNWADEWFQKWYLKMGKTGIHHLTVTLTLPFGSCLSIQQHRFISEISWVWNAVIQVHRHKLNAHLETKHSSLNLLLLLRNHSGEIFHFHKPPTLDREVFPARFQKYQKNVDSLAQQ